jgi:uncharacterized protein (TIGR00661 family)
MQKIFYGVQGTGNGHITRARVMAKALAKAGITPQFQFTGRPPEQYFDMEIFGDYQVKSGLTFSTHNGTVSYLNTVLTAKPGAFIRDVRSLDLSDYDCVISDFEPVTAWAAKRQGKPVLGIGHQYAFPYNIPRAGNDPIAEWVLRYFAPAQLGVGLHWHHFGQPILPPIIETPERPQSVQNNKIVVYLPFELVERVMEFLAEFAAFEFHVYSPKVIASKYQHIHIKALSRDGFQQDLANCVGIISNAGFELASESLQLGKKILVKPLHKQMEQLANAAAIKQLQYGEVMMELDRDTVARWLDNNRAIRIDYPDVAQILVDWMLQGMPTMTPEFIEEVWSQALVEQIEYPL